MAKSPFSVNEIYSLGYWLKDYGYYPKNWPLYTYMDHGMTFFDKIPPHEINNRAPLLFKFSPRLVAEYKKVSDKPVYNLINPTIHCRNKKNIDLSSGAKGTLFFPAHTTELIDDNTAWDVFIANLDSIPEQFKPLDICLHPTDIKKGLKKVFEDKNFKVLTAGAAQDEKFAENFYQILRNYKYTMSNLLGSYVFYSVEMGIPFSLFGDEPKFYNRGDENIEMGNYVSYKGQPTYKKAIDLFTGFHTTVSPAQKEFVEDELGKNNSISRTRAALLLYSALLQYKVISPAKRKIRSAFVRLFLLKKIAGQLRFKIAHRYNRNEEWKLVHDKYITLGELNKLKSASISDAVLLGRPVLKTDNFWYLHSLKEIFAEEVYRFRAGTETPFILDCGSNIGLSVIYFKRAYPKARIIAFEPDQQICGFLKKNLHEFGYDDVDVQDKAIWTEETMLNFSATGNLGGKIESHDGNASNQHTIKVRTARLKNYLTETVDFLKIDIEGPELEVLKDCSDLLINVRHLFVEYHSDPAKEQELDNILSLLKKAGFRVYIKEAWNNLPFPFLRQDYNPFYDLQLNIFAYRP